jgi:hypothetical protein
VRRPLPATDVLLALAAAAIAFVVYVSSGPAPTSYDTAPASLLAFDLFEEHRLDFDAFRGGYFAEPSRGYGFMEAPNGHLESLFPVGTSLVTLPIYGAFELARAAGGDTPPIVSPGFEPLRRGYEHLAAALVAALSVALVFLCAREIAGIGGAAAATAAYAFGTSMWSTASQALWQHGPVNAFTAAMIFALFRAGRATAAAQTRWLAAAGICAGLLPVIRPTAVLFSLAAAVFVWTAFRVRGWWFTAALAIGIAPGVAWNLAIFHTLAGGYAANAHAYDLAPAHAAAAFAALLVSPSRGIFVFSPVLLFALPGAVRAWRSSERNARLVALLALACVVLAVQYAFFRYWWAGYTYGPRFLTDVAAVAALALAYALPKHPRSLAGATFALALAWSVAVQFAGTASGAAGSDWNAVPVSIDRAPERVWPLADDQIARNMRAVYARYITWEAARTPAYVAGVAVRVASCAPALPRVAAGATVATTASVIDDGPSRAYGYDSGTYVGQLRLRVRVVDANGDVVSEQQLYVRGSPATGERAEASGELRMPLRAGTYRLECLPELIGLGNGGNSDALLLKNRPSVTTKEVVL